MKGGTENRKKTIAAGALGAGALVCAFFLAKEIFGGPDTPPPVTAVAVAGPSSTAPKPSPGSTRTVDPNLQPTSQPGGVAPGVQAQRLARVNSTLDPTLDQVAMLRTESLVYTGNGRNIFSAIYTPPVPTQKIIVPNITARPPLPPPPTPCPPACPPPPPPPPINLKFFGTAQRPNGTRQAFLLSGDDVYLASQGDIVARKYKIVTVNANSLSVTDLTNNNTQTLPLQMN